MLNKSFKQH